MPELPEVEYTRQNLERWMQGARIKSVETRDARIVRPNQPRAFVSALTRRRIEGIERRGKWLKLVLDDGRRMFVHLGMTGWFERGMPDDSPLRFERVRFTLERDGKPSRVVYVDARRWGRMILSDEDIPTWKALGPDPLADGIDLDALKAKLLRRKKRSLKEALMDQRVLAGIGNVQVTEGLWKAGIDPRSKASAISKADLKRIGRGLRWTIDRTLAELAKGVVGSDHLRVYGRKGEPCPRCGHVLERFDLGGRTTTACPGCQERRT